MENRLPPPSTRGLWAIVDCNNFFASCETLFRPDLKGRPLVVLSSNDGCVIARSAEAKSLGIKMGVPAFQLKGLFEANNVEVFSSNFRLYSEVSRRVMEILAHFCPKVEQYSIDEAFLYLDGVLEACSDDFCPYLIDRVLHYAGVPVSIGLARTRTLAKLASHIAKRRRCGTFSLATDEKSMVDLLSGIRVEEVWGVGRRLAKRLAAQGIETVAQLRAADPFRMQRLYSVNVFNTILELRGVPMIDVGAGGQRRTLAASRSFGNKVTDLADLREAVATFTGQALKRLRTEGLVARCIEVRIRTSYFGRVEFFERTSSEYLERYSSDTIAFTQAAMRCLERIYEPGHPYAKAGVLLTDVKSPDQVQRSLLDMEVSAEEERRSRLMAVMDSINARYAPGDARLRLASEGCNKEAPWRTLKAHKSPDHEFHWEPITEEPGSGPLKAARARKSFPPPNVM